MVEKAGKGHIYNFLIFRIFLIFFFFFLRGGGRFWEAKPTPPSPNTVPLTPPPLSPSFPPSLPQFFLYKAQSGVHLHPPQPSGRLDPEGGGGGAGATAVPPPFPMRGGGRGRGGFIAPLAGLCVAARRRPSPDPPAAHPRRHGRERNFHGAQPGETLMELGRTGKLWGCG